jgi:hypothetical protein
LDGNVVVQPLMVLGWRLVPSKNHRFEG